MKRVLITGATGFVGRNAIDPLLEHGFEVHATYVGRALDRDDVSWHECDLLDTAALRTTLREARPSHLLHFAWNVEHGKYWTSPQNLEWLAASLQLIRAFKEFGGKRFVGAGTCAEYEWGNAGRCDETGTPLRPATLYGASKNALRQVAEAFSHATDLEFAWGRIFLTYGPHEDPARLVPAVTRSLLRGEPARCSPGNHLRDFLHVQDVAAAFAALTDSSAEGSFNIGSGEPVAVNEVARKLASLVGRDDLLQLGALAEREGDPAVLVADTARLRKELRWQPRFTLEQGLEHTVSWWRTQVVESHASPV